jgi:hypothetical protein
MRIGIMSQADRDIAQAIERYGTARAGVYGETGGARLETMRDVSTQMAGAQERMGVGMADITARESEARLGVMGQMDRTRALMEAEYGTGMADIFRTGGEARIGIRSSMDQAVSLARSNMAAQYADLYRGTTADIGAAMQAGTSAIASALGNIADKREMAFNLNYLQPYQAQRQYIIEEMRRTDPTNWYTNFLSQMAGATFGTQAQGIAGWATGIDMAAGAPGRAMGNYFQSKFLDMWGGQGVNRNTGTTFTPQHIYNYPGSSRSQYIPKTGSVGTDPYWRTPMGTLPG